MPKKFYLLLILTLHSILSAQSQVDSIAIYKKNNQIQKAIDYANKQSENHKKRQKWNEYARTLASYAQIYIDANEHGKAQKILFDGLNQTENAKSKTASSIIRFKIASCYYHMRDISSAIKHYQQILKDNRKEKIDSLDGNAYQGLYASYWNQQGAQDSTAYYLKKTLQYSRRSRSPIARHRALNNASAYYYQIGNPELSKIYMDSLVAFNTQIGDNQQLATALTNQAAFFITHEKDYRKAKANYDRIFRLLNNDTLNSSIGEQYYTYADILENLGDHKGALHYLNKAYDIRHKSLNREKERIVWELENKFQINQIEKQYAEKELKNLQLQQRKNKVIVIMAGLFIFAIVLFFFLIQNIKLKQKNREQQLENSMQLKLLSATIDGQESERKKIAQVLHDNISALLSSASMQLSFVSTIVPESAKGIAKARDIIRESHDLVRHLSHELIPVLLSKFGLAYALNDLCEKNTTAQLKFNCSIDKNLKRMDSDFEMKVFYMISELLNNVIKHSKATEAQLILQTKGNNLSIHVQDNGIGFDSQNKRLEGFGITHIRARVNNLNGRLGIESRPDFGTSVHITLPIPA